MIVDYTIEEFETTGKKVKRKIRIPNIPEHLKDKVTPKYRSETDDFELIPTKEYQWELDKEKLRQEFDQKLEERVNEIANHIESGLRGKELADEIRKK